MSIDTVPASSVTTVNSESAMRTPQEIKNAIRGEPTAIDPSTKADVVDVVASREARLLASGNLNAVANAFADMISENAVLGSTPNPKLLKKVSDKWVSAGTALGLDISPTLAQDRRGQNYYAHVVFQRTNEPRYSGVVIEIRGSGPNARVDRLYTVIWKERHGKVAPAESRADTPATFHRMTRPHDVPKEPQPGYGYGWRIYGVMEKIK